MDVMYDERSDRPVPRAAAPKPTGPNGENLTQWAIKIVVKFREDCENGMHIYHGYAELQAAVQAAAVRPRWCPWVGNPVHATRRRPGRRRREQR